MDLNKSTIKKILLIITFAILLFIGLENLNSVKNVAISIFKLFTPFILGACMAFIMNVPMSFFERKLFRVPANYHSDEEPSSKENPKKTLAKEAIVKVKKTVKSKHRPGEIMVKIKNAVARPLSLVLTLVLILGVIAVVIFLIVPELARTGNVLIVNIEKFIKNLFALSQDFFKNNPTALQQITEWSKSIDFSSWSKIGDTVLSWLASSGTQVLSSTFGVASSIIGGFVSFFVGLIFSFYILLQKEKLGRQAKQIAYSFIPEKIADKTISIAGLSYNTFAKFLSGQCLEAVILGVMFFIAMSIFKFPYTLMISVVIAFTALVPIFGTFIGCAIGTFLILMINPVSAFWFIVMFLIIQQIEGNLIYPYVVGGSVGLPSIWVLAAVTLGGSTMGVAGMLIFIPLCSVLYALLRELVYFMLKKKNISSSKWRITTPKR